MAILTGFGTRKQALAQSSNRNVIVQLRSQSPDARFRLRGIYYSYGLIAGSAAVFSQGRLLIVQGRFNDEAAELLSNTSADTNGDILADVPIFDHNLSRKDDFIPFGEFGLLCPKGTDISIILCAPTTATEAQPAFITMLGSLTVIGSSEGMTDPYPKLR